MIKYNIYHKTYTYIRMTKIFYTVSKRNLESHFDEYLFVLNELKRFKDIKVVSTIEKTYLKNSKYKKVKDLALKTSPEYRFIHSRNVRRAIYEADAVVIEASYQSFRLGFEAHYSVSLRKPTLVLSKFDDYGKLIDAPNFFGYKYTEFLLPDILEKFISYVKRNKLRERFNLFLSKEHKKILAENAKKLGVTQSEYIRMLIEKSGDYS